MVGDPRCLRYYIFKPDPTVTTVYYEYCSRYETFNGVRSCDNYETATTTSTYEYSFSYSGEQCASAVLDTYGPVNLGLLIFSSFGTAMPELLVPGLHRWADSNAHRASWLRADGWVRKWLESAFPLHTLVGEWRATDDGAPNQAQKLVERALQKLIGILLVNLTFGLAAPLVAGAALLSAPCVAVHHTFLLGKLAAHFGHEDQDIPELPPIPLLRGSCGLSKRTGLLILTITLAVWAAAMYRQLDASGNDAVATGFGAGFGAVLGVTALAAFAVATLKGGLTWWCTKVDEGLKRWCTASPPPSQQTAMYQKLLDDTEHAMVLDHHARSMMKRYLKMKAEPEVNEAAEEVQS